LRAAADVPGNAHADAEGTVPFGPLPDSAVTGEWPDPPMDVPVLYGHYWRWGTPSVDVGGTSACLDWSVAKGGPLVAYRWSGESMLDAANLVAVPASV